MRIFSFTSNKSSISFVVVDNSLYSLSYQICSQNFNVIKSQVSQNNSNVSLVQDRNCTYHNNFFDYIFDLFTVISSLFANTRFYRIFDDSWHNFFSLRILLPRFFNFDTNSFCIKIFSLRFLVFPVFAFWSFSFNLKLFSIYFFGAFSDRFLCVVENVQVFPRHEIKWWENSKKNYFFFPLTIFLANLIFFKLQLYFSLNFSWAFFLLLFSLYSLSCRKLCVTPSEWKFQLFNDWSDSFE